ncbi:hypothetical protein ACRAWG_31465 [Methylobacterium sp. P31]
MTFKEWLKELNAEARRRNYGLIPLSFRTGTRHWGKYYKNGYSPAEALSEDENYGISE